MLSRVGSGRAAANELHCPWARITRIWRLAGDKPGGRGIGVGRIPDAGPEFGTGVVVAIAEDIGPGSHALIGASVFLEFAEGNHQGEAGAFLSSQTIQADGSGVGLDLGEERDREYEDQEESHERQSEEKGKT
ncbi:MAG: hypothetical protein AAF546_00455 [Verrucomicrobiota bacterium]